MRCNKVVEENLEDHWVDQSISLFYSTLANIHTHPHAYIHTEEYNQMKPYCVHLVNKWWFIYSLYFPFHKEFCAAWHLSLFIVRTHGIHMMTNIHEKEEKNSITNFNFIYFFFSISHLQLCGCYITTVWQFSWSISARSFFYEFNWCLQEGQYDLLFVMVRFFYTTFRMYIVCCVNQIQITTERIQWMRLIAKQINVSKN